MPLGKGWDPSSMLLPQLRLSELPDAKLSLASGNHLLHLCLLQMLLSQGGRLFFPDVGMLMQVTMHGVLLPSAASPCPVPGRAGLLLPRMPTAACGERGWC